MLQSAFKVEMLLSIPGNCGSIAFFGPGALATFRMLQMLTLTVSALAPRIAVFGGSGFIGSRITETLIAAGCEVTAVSRSGRPPAWADSKPWCKRVQWQAMDVLAEDADASQLLVVVA